MQKIIAKNKIKKLLAWISMLTLIAVFLTPISKAKSTYNPNPAYPLKANSNYQKNPTYSTQTYKFPKSPAPINQYPSTPKPTGIKLYSMQGADCSSPYLYDAAFNTTLSSVSYIAPNGIKIVIVVENRGRSTMNDIVIEVKNITTNQILLSGIHTGSLESCSGYRTIETTIHQTANGEALKLFQGQNTVQMRIASSDSTTPDQNLVNNTAEFSYSIPSIDLSISSNDYAPYINTNTRKFDHATTIRNNGTANSGAFTTRIELNGQTDAQINFASIAGGGYTTQRPSGNITAKNRYNFARILVDPENAITEQNESKGIAETNNKLNVEIDNYGYYTNSRIYQASNRWFMYLPQLISENGQPAITVPILNISESTILTSPTLSIYLNSCNGTPIKSTTINYLAISANQSREDLKVTGFTTSDLQNMNGKNICVQFKEPLETVMRTITVGFPDLIVKSYSTSVVGAARLSYPSNVNRYLSVAQSIGLQHSVTVQNIGGAETAGRLSVKVYLNGQLDGTAGIETPLAAGAETTIPVAPVLMPLNGFNIVKIVVDKENTILEGNEANNSGFYETKVVNNQIEAGFPKQFTESANFYLYRPIIESNTTGTRFVNIMVNMSGEAKNTKFKFENWLSQNNWPNTNEYITNSWTDGAYQEFKSSYIDSSDCYFQIKTFVGYKINEGRYSTYVQDNIFNSTDINNQSACIR